MILFNRFSIKHINNIFSKPMFNNYHFEICALISLVDCGLGEGGGMEKFLADVRLYYRFDGDTDDDWVAKGYANATIEISDGQILIKTGEVVRGIVQYKKLNRPHLKDIFGGTI